MSPSGQGVGRSPVLQAVDRFAGAFLTRHRQVTVACSGGADSLALAAAAVTVLGPERVAGVTIDHGLQSGSAAQAERVRDQLRALGYRTAEIRAVQVTGGGGPEAAARAARYAALDPGPDGAVLLAHTLDDQAETVLLGLGRGSGPRSIAGMRPWRPPWGRPLLGVRRADTENYCVEMNVTAWRDPHNLNPRYTRVRLRREVLPLLEDVLGGGVAPALARTAQLLAADLTALDEIAERALGEVDADGELDLRALRAHPAAVRTRVLRSWLTAHGVLELTHGHLSRLDELVTGTGRDGVGVRLPGTVDAVRDSGRLIVRKVR